MIQLVPRCAVRHLRPSCPAQNYRLRSIAVRAKTDQPQPNKDDSPKDNREVSARPVAGNKGPSSRPAAQSPTPDDIKKQHNQPVRSENANQKRREAGGKSIANPTTSIRQNSDTRKPPLDAGWGPVEQDRDAVGVILTSAFVLGAFVLTTILFKAIGGYRAANTSKQLRPDTGITTIKGEEAAPQTKTDKASDRKQSEATNLGKSSSQDAAQTTSDPASKGQQQKTDAVASDNHDKDDEADFSSDSDHVTDGSDQDQEEGIMHESILGQEHQQGTSDSAQTSPSGDGQEAATSAQEGAEEADHSSSDMSIGALKQKVSTAMRASASAADASKSASGWSTSAAEASSRAAESAERASAAASRAQYTLQGAAEAEAKDLASRIASAEAAVEQAEQAAAEAVQFQGEASKAASVADRHSMNAADQADTANRLSSLDPRAVAAPTGHPSLIPQTPASLKRELLSLIWEVTVVKHLDCLQVAF